MSKIGSFIILLLGVAILLLSYVFPIFLIPVGSYSHSSNNVTTSYTFQLNDKFKAKAKLGSSSTETKAYYEIDDKEIYWSLTEDVPETAINKLAKIKNIYTIEIGGTKFRNNVALGFTIAGYVLTAVGVITLVIPKKKKRK